MSKPPETIGRYRIERSLGKGAMGAVYRARAPDGEAVAVKVLTQLDARGLRRFAREFEVGRAIVHPHVVRTLEVGEAAGQPYIVMELVTGSTLSDMMAAGTVFSPSELAELVDQLAAGLAELHAHGVTHRDIKPQNLMVAPGGVLKVMDLGLVRAEGRTQLTATGTCAGTPFYMSPEQMVGDPVGPTADLFAAAIIVYQLLTRRHPFRRQEKFDLGEYFQVVARDPPAPWSDDKVGGPLDRFFGRALAKDPAGRFPDAASFAAALRAALAAEGGEGRAEAPTVELESAPFASGVRARVPSAALSPPGPAPAAGAGRPLLAGAALVVLGLLGLQLLPEPEVPVLDVEILETSAGQVAVMLTGAAVQPRVPGGRVLASSPDGKSHACLLGELGGGPRISTPGGRTLWASDRGRIKPRPMRVVERRFEASGRLLLKIAGPQRVPLVLVPARGDPIPELGREQGIASFALDDPERDGFVPYQVALDLSGPLVPWGSLDRLPGLEDRIRDFMTRLDDLDALAWLAACQAGPDSGRALHRRLEAEGYVDFLAELGQVLAGRLAAARGDEPEYGPLLRGLPKLRFLDACVLSLGEVSPIDCETPGLAGLVAPADDSTREPADSPSLLRFPFRQDHVSTDQGRGASMFLSPENLMSKPFGTRSLAAPAADPRGAWLAVHVRRVRGFAYRFYGLVTINGNGPLFVFESPRHAAPLKHGSDGDAWFNRRYRLAIPPGWLAPQNRVTLEFHSWPRPFPGVDVPSDEAVQNESLRDSVPVQAVSLAPASAP